MAMLMEKDGIEELLKRAKYTHNLTQSKELRRLALERYGAEKIALLDSDEIEMLFKNDNIMPMLVGGCGSEHVFLVDCKVLETASVISAHRQNEN